MKRFARRRNRMAALALLLTAALLAVTAVVALAANLSGDGTIIGTTGSDNITAGAGNDTVYGLGGSDNINAGNGNDMIDGGGACEAGVASGVYPHGLPSSEYCQHGPHTPCGSDNISAGAGSDSVWGNCGSNNISLGNGSDTVYAYGGPNTVNVGNGTDTIEAYGVGSYSTGTGRGDVIDANYHSSGYTINCGSKYTTVYVVKGNTDHISSNCTVKNVAGAIAPSVRHRAKKHAKHQTKRHHKRHVTGRR